MREKQLRLLLTFHTTAAAMAMDRFCARQAVPGRLIPVPRAITAGCGMCWSAPPEAEAAVLQAAAEAGVEAAGVYQMLV